MREYLFNKLKEYGEFALAIGIIGILLVLLFPVPTVLLDILLAFSITSSIMILMTTLFISKPLELSVFPTILLVTTILRLSLNIASTRLILANGHNGTDAAGHIIEAFGDFVMQGNVGIGLIVFMILTLINFIVITKGSGRIAEVAARFNLDAMPGKQMAVDSDLAAGLINEETAKSRRKELEEENTFYGAMDGANKFVRGDAIAGLIITFINLVGGIIIGIVQRNLSFSNAVSTYTILTIGDGLVSQIPSLIISLSAGLLVTKSGVAGSADKAIFGQLSQYPQAMYMSCIVTALMATLPGLPFMPFFVLSVASGFIGYTIKTSRASQEYALAGAPGVAGGKGSDVGQQAVSRDKVGIEAKDDKLSEVLYLDPVKLELGYNLLQLVNYTKGHKLTDQIKALRKQIVKEYGFVMPAVRIQDNLKLPNNKYVIKIKEIEAGSGEVMLDKLMVMDPVGNAIKIPGIDTKEPTFGLPARWIDDNYREDAIFQNYTVVDPSTVITTHITEIIKENITELLSYGEVQSLIDELADEYKKMVKDIVPDVLSISVIQKILHNLLKESVSIRDLPTILEAAADSFSNNKSVLQTTEMVRLRLARQICNANLYSDGFLQVLTLSPEWEKSFIESIVVQDGEKKFAMQPSKTQEFLTKTKRKYDEQAAHGIVPVLLTSPIVRPYVKSVIDRFRHSIAVMSQNEIHAKTRIRTLGSV